MPQPARRRHDISGAVWEKLEPHLSGREKSRGGKAHDNRPFTEAVFWTMRTGEPWRTSRQISAAGVTPIGAYPYE